MSKLAVSGYCSADIIIACDFPGVEKVAMLMVIVVHMDQLNPEKWRGAENPQWQDTPEFNLDFKHAQKLTLELLEMVDRLNPGFRDMLRGIECDLNYRVTLCIDELRRIHGKVPQWAEFTLCSLADCVQVDKSVVS